MPTNMLTVTDHRTGQKYSVPIQDGAIKASDLSQIKISGDGSGLVSYDPAYANTASCQSSITLIDGDQGDTEVSWLPDRAARRGVHFPGNGLPRRLRPVAHCESVRRVDAQHYDPHHAA